MILEMAFPIEWLDSKAEDDAQGRTNREIVTVVSSTKSLIKQFKPLTIHPNPLKVYRRRIELTRPQKLVGHISQMVAGLTHYVSPDRLHHISRSIPKILILTGDDDHLVRPSGSFHLKKHMPEAEFIQWEKTGHAIHMQHVKRFNKLLERVFAEGRQHAPTA